MALITKIKSINITQYTTIFDVAEALGCNGTNLGTAGGEYGILTMQDIGSGTPPTYGYAISGIGTSTWTIYALINGEVVTGTNLKTISSTLYYLKHENYVAFSDTSTYMGYGFIKGKDTTAPDTPDMWACYTEYSANVNTQQIYLWDVNSTATGVMNTLIALTNNKNLVILTPLFNPDTGWVSSGSVYYATERPAAYNTPNSLYDFVMNNKNYALYTCVSSSISAAKSMICFDYTDAIE